MNIIYKKISGLKPYDRNPRINDGAVPAVMASIKEYGFKVPIVIDIGSKEGVMNSIKNNVLNVEEKGYRVKIKGLELYALGEDGTEYNHFYITKMMDGKYYAFLSPEGCMATDDKLLELRVRRVKNG